MTSLRHGRRQPATVGPGSAGVTVTGLRAGYGRIEVLHGIDLVVPAGSVLALFGPNGAGKSTLLAVVRGQLRPTCGTVTVGGLDAVRTPTERLARAGVCAVPEGRAVFPNLTVREHLRLWTYAGGAGVGEVEAATYERFPRLAERRHQLAGTLSGGEQQMLAISRALVGSPKVLLLDELSTGLAPLVVAELYELVAALAATGMAVLIVEQFVTTALAVATQAAVLVHGRIVREGPPSQVADVALGDYLSG